MKFSLDIEIMFLIVISTVFITSFLAFLIHKLIANKMMNQKVILDKTRKEVLLEIKYLVSKYISNVNDANELVSSGILKNVDRTVKDITYLILHEYSNNIDPDMSSKDMGLIQDLLELYLENDLYTILLPRMKQVYNVTLASSIEQSELTDLIESLTHNLIDSMALGIKRYTHLSKVFADVEQVLTNNTRKIFEIVRIAINDLSNIRAAYDSALKGINDEAASKVYELIQELGNTENDGINS